MRRTTTDSRTKSNNRIPHGPQSMDVAAILKECNEAFEAFEKVVKLQTKKFEREGHDNNDSHVTKVRYPL